MNDEARRVESFTADELAAIRTYWSYFSTHSEAVTAEVGRRARELPGWGTLADVIAPDDHVLQHAAIVDGAWEPYLADLRSRGVAYATAGIEYGTWTQLVWVHRDQIRDRMLALLQSNPDKQAVPVQQIGNGMTLMLDLRLLAIGNAYFGTKHARRLETEAQYEALFQASPHPLFTYATDTNIFVDVNEALCRLTGYTRAELVGMSFETLGVAEAPPEIPTGRGIVGPMVRGLRHRDGRILRVEVRANDIVSHGRTRRLVSLVDVTEREAAREALKRTEMLLHHGQKMEALGRLAGGVAHDFNNILTVVGSYACMLEESLDAADPRHADATEIRLAAERAAQITRRLLALGRHSIVAPKPLLLDDLIAGFRPLLRRLVGERVAVEVLRGDVPPIVADAGQLEQVLMNLAVNARDAMGGVGRLTIETSQVTLGAEGEHGLAPGAYVMLAITDTGAGIAPEVRDRIFEPFFTTKEAGQGTGLGLSIVHGIVAQANGAITVFSKPGHGASFRIHVPISELAGVAPEPPPILAPVKLPPLAVLVVDDQPDIRAATTRVLQDSGCTVLAAASAADARHVCVSHDGVIDVAVIDVVLSDGRGDALARELRALRPALQVLLTSGYPAGALGPSGDAPAGLLAKPFSPAQLRDAIARIVPAAGEVRAEPVLQSRVLLVDDDPDLRKMLSRLLRRAAFEIIEVDSGRKALAALESARFDVVLSDVHMPDGDGLEVLRGVRRLDLDIPVILISGKPDVASAATALEYGAFRYLTKPVDTEAVERVVRQAARQHALARIRRQAITINGGSAGASDRAGLEVRFEQALAHLWLAFQPIYDARTGELFGVEALMRSREPSIPHPGALLDAASALGRLPMLGRRVRQLAGTALGGRADIPSLFVNLHPEDLMDVDLVSAEAALTAIAPRVILEVTERESLATSAALGERLARLREMGFRIAVDDIGAGYSGLTSFADLTPEVVKIDMSLVRAIHTSTLKQRTIGALCSLCHEVGALVVGEGVETSDERDCLRDLGCDLLQGYLLGKPSPQLPV